MFCCRIRKDSVLKGFPIRGCAPSSPVRVHMEAPQRYVVPTQVPPSPPSTGAPCVGIRLSVIDVIGRSIGFSAWQLGRCFSRSLDFAVGSEQTASWRNIDFSATQSKFTVTKPFTGRSLLRGRLARSDSQLQTSFGNAVEGTIGEF